MGSYISQLKLEVAEEEQHLSEFDKLKLQSFVDEAVALFSDKGRDQVVVCFAAKQVELAYSIIAGKNNNSGNRKEEVKQASEEQQRMISKSYLTLSLSNEHISKFKICV